MEAEKGQFIGENLLPSMVSARFCAPPRHLRAREGTAAERRPAPTGTRSEPDDKRHGKMVFVWGSRATARRESDHELHLSNVFRSLAEIRLCEISRGWQHRARPAITDPRDAAGVRAYNLRLWTCLDQYGVGKNGLSKPLFPSPWAYMANSVPQKIRLLHQMTGGSAGKQFL